MSGKRGRPPKFSISQVQQQLNEELNDNPPVENRPTFKENLLQNYERNWATTNELKHENRCIERICKEFGYDKYPVLRAYTRDTGKRPPFLLWDYFYEEYQDFPVYLRSSRIKHLRGLKGIELGSFFQSFQESKLCREFFDVLEQYGPAAASRPIGLIAPFGGLSGGILVHSQQRPMSPGPAWTLTARGIAKETVLWVEPWLRCIKAWGVDPNE